MTCVLLAPLEFAADGVNGCCETTREPDFVRPIESPEQVFAVLALAYSAMPALMRLEWTV